MNLCQRGTLYTCGYAHPETAARVARLMSNPAMLLVDIRYRPRSRWQPAWNRNALAGIYGARYVWDRRLGNLNYQHRECGIALAEGHAAAVQEAAALLCAGTSLLLLCACKDARTCHRTLVAKYIQDAVQTVQEGGCR
jgi:uncharacterized protein (DUF488 family)